MNHPEQRKHRSIKLPTKASKAPHQAGTTYHTASTCRGIDQPRKTFEQSVVSNDSTIKTSNRPSDIKPPVTTPKSALVVTGGVRDTGCRRRPGDHVGWRTGGGAL